MITANMVALYSAIVAHENLDILNDVDGWIIPTITYLALRIMSEETKSPLIEYNEEKWQGAKDLNQFCNEFEITLINLVSADDEKNLKPIRHLEELLTKEPKHNDFVKKYICNAVSKVYALLLTGDIYNYKSYSTTEDMRTLKSFYADMVEQAEAELEYRKRIYNLFVGEEI